MNDTATISRDLSLFLLQHAQVILWDTGGMERYGMRNMTHSYFSKSSCVILVYDTGNLESLNELKDWIEIVRDFTDSSTLLSLWGNETGNEQNPVDEEAVYDFRVQHGISSSLTFTVAVSSGDNLIESFKKVVNAVHLTNTNPRRARELYGESVNLSQQKTHKKSCCGF